MFVFISGSIPPVRFGPGGTDPAEISIPAVTYTLYTTNEEEVESRNARQRAGPDKVCTITKLGKTKWPGGGVVSPIP